MIFFWEAIFLSVMPSAYRIRIRMKKWCVAVLWLTGLWLVCWGSSIQSAGHAAEDTPSVRIGVAANFYHTLRALQPLFQQAHQARLVISVGSTGGLYAQIVNGAPYDVFLSADARRPRLLVEKKVVNADKVFTYAVGRLVLWSNTPQMPASEQTLRKGAFKYVALATPKLAPYGMAAWRVLEQMQLRQVLVKKMVYGTSVAQVHQFVESGNAQLGFLAFSQVRSDKRKTSTVWEPPAEWLGNVLNQDVVLLKSAEKNEAAQQFMRFLRSKDAKAIIKETGYDLP